MIVVADSGSTKTEWRLCSEQEVIGSAHTAGLNPLALDKGATISELRRSELEAWLEHGIEAVYFYGAGIVDQAQRQAATGNLKLLFHEAAIVVESDLVGAARAVFQSASGVVAILGTGSNTGYYDGKTIIRNIPALGYILADEGSGSVLGRLLLKHFLRKELPASVSEAFKEYYPDYNNLIETIYSEKHAARFLASFVPFIYQHREDEFIRGIVMQELKKFIDLLKSYPSQKIGIVGSVGFQFQNELNLLARAADLNIVDYLKNPIDKIAAYHLKRRV